MAYSEPASGTPAAPEPPLRGGGSLLFEPSRREMPTGGILSCPLRERLLGARPNALHSAGNTRPVAKSRSGAVSGMWKIWGTFHFPDTAPSLPPDRVRPALRTGKPRINLLYGWSVAAPGRRQPATERGV
jgi:hypothetical protein